MEHPDIGSRWRPHSCIRRTKEQHASRTARRCEVTDPGIVPEEEPASREMLTDIVFRESTTIGVRFQQMDRACLERTIETVQTPYGPVRFKVARRDGRELNAAPEFEDCEVLATKHGVPLKVVQAAALQARALS